MNNKELVELVQKQLGDEYFELLQVGTVIGIMCEELNDEEVSEKVDELIEFIKNKAKKILDRK